MSSTLRQLVERLRRALRGPEDPYERLRDDLILMAAALEVDANALFYRDQLEEKEIDALLAEARRAAAAHKEALRQKLKEQARGQHQGHRALQLVQELEDKAMEALRQQRLDLYDEAMRRREEYAAQAREVRVKQSGRAPALEQAQAAMHRFEGVMETLACRRHALHADHGRQEASRALDSLERALDAKAEPPLLRALEKTASQAVARMQSDGERLHKRLEHSQTLATQYDEKAHQALAAGQAELGEEALMRQLEHSQLARRYQSALQAHDPQAQALRERLEALRGALGALEAP